MQQLRGHFVGAQPGRVIAHLRRAVLPRAGAEPGDGELLGRFVAAQLPLLTQQLGAASRRD